MAKTATTPLDQKRVSQIAQQIRGAVTDFTDANKLKVSAADDAKALAKAEVNTRESIMITLADLSQTGQWTNGEINLAAARAAEIRQAQGQGSNDTSSEKALATFIGESKRAMHPNVRSHVKRIIELRDEAWDNESYQLEADPKAPKPLRKAFARKYHMLIQMFGETADGRVFSDHSEILDWAAACDPDLDLDKVKKRLERIKQELVAFYTDWPVDDIQVCVDALNDVTEKALKASRAGNVVDLPVKPKAAEQTTTTVVPETSDDEPEVAEGAVDVSDLIDEALGDRATLAA